MVIEHGNKSGNVEGFELDLSQEHIEPMLQENLDRFVLFPIQHADVRSITKVSRYGKAMAKVCATSAWI